MTLKDAERIAAMLEDALPVADDAALRSVREKFPEFTWIAHQFCPPIVIVTDGAKAVPLRF